jgi:hypothetical protein
MAERKRAPLFAKPASAGPQGSHFSSAETGFDAHTGVMERDGMHIDKRERGDTGEAQPCAPRLHGGEKWCGAGRKGEEADECGIVEMVEEEIRAYCIERARLAQPIENIGRFHTHVPSRTLQCAQGDVGDTGSAIHEEESRTVSIGKCREKVLRRERAITAAEFGKRPRWT